MRRGGWNPMLLAALAGAVWLGACEDGDDPTPGSIEVFGQWDGEVPAGANLKLAGFECPFTMPPEYDVIGTVSAAGEVHGLIEEVAPGDWCVQAFIDMDPDDGLLPVDGVDAMAVLATPDAESIPVTVAEGEAVVLDLEFEVDDGVDTSGDEPGPDDVWLRITAECPTCDTAAPVIFYGYEGDQLGTVPDLYNKLTEDVSFPFTFAVKESGPMAQVPITAGQYIVSVYQDLDDEGMQPEAGEPASAPEVVTFVAGQWNELTVTLE